jgi:hypothetical protein
MTSSARQTAGADASGRVILVSLDGMGTRLFLDDPVSSELRALAALRARGVMADGLVPHMPSTTANTHAALWTGAWGDVNGITSNDMPLPPRSQRRAFDRVSGYRSDGLRAEPIWVAAARQGVPTVTQQATQVYPLRERVTGGDLALPPTLLHGYQAPVIAPARWLRRSDLATVPCAGDDARPGPSGSGPSIGAVTCMTWTSGEVIFRAALSAGRGGQASLRVRVDGAARSVDVPLAATEHEPPRGRVLARHFSDGLLVDLAGHGPAMAYFRLFEASPDGRSIVLFQSVAQEFVLYTGHEATRAESIAFLDNAGGFIGNGDDEPWEARGVGGLSIAQGGDGTRERRYLETLELGIRQAIRQAEYLWRTHTPRLMIAYVSMPDELDHAWLGEAGRDARLEPLRRWGYQLVDRTVETYAGFVSGKDHIVFVSDHGMTPVTHEARMNIALRDAGLVVVDGRGRVDAARSKVLFGRNCLMVHTVDWKDGVVPHQAARAVLGEAIAAVGAVRGADGQPVITGMFSSSADRERLGFGGSNGFDACFDVRAGYVLGTWVDDGPVVRQRPRPTG